MIRIGLECHLQLRTESKLFCECPASYRNIEANINICPTCTSQPGAKPYFINEKTVENGVKIALALRCELLTNREIYIQRKHYFYPDLPSNYQRTSKPIGVNGYLEGVRIKEVHIEEDPGRYEPKKGLVDYNRSGVPLIEIVTEPDISSPESARAFLEELSKIMEYLDAIREEPGSIRIDANISLGGGKRVEIKNINSYKGVFTALKYEILRQNSLFSKGMEVIQETRHFDEERGITISLRKKEMVEDYRYFPDPDVPPIKIEENLVEEIRKKLPELPKELAERLVKEYGIREEEANVIVSEKELAELFETLAENLPPQECAFWIKGQLKKQLNYRGLPFKNSGLKAEVIKELLSKLFKKEITEKTGEEILISLFDEPHKISFTSEQRRMSDEKELRKIVEIVISENKKAVEDYKGGEKKALHFLSGKVMQKTKGRADPNIVHKLLEEKLNE